jgi:hypothetical protein
MPEHSPEPWDIVKDTYVTHEGDGKDPACWIESSDCRFIAETEYADRPPETARADARRIVACVNACIGLSTEMLEKCGSPEGLPLITAVENASITFGPHTPRQTRAKRGG